MSDEKTVTRATAEVNKLPDAAFAVVLDGGELDEEGKTVPRDLRKLPHHTGDVTDPNDNETLDMPRLQNALARVSQIDAPASVIEQAEKHLRKHWDAVKAGEEKVEKSTECVVPTPESTIHLDASEYIGLKEVAEADGLSPVVVSRSASSGVSSELGEIELGERQLLWQISDSEPDTGKLVIEAKGVDLEHFRANGSVMWNHVKLSPEFVLGKPVDVFERDDKLFTLVEFTPREINPLGYMTYELAKGGFVSGSSVGIAPLEVEEGGKEDPFIARFTRSLLMELSVTPIPANPRAVIKARSLGVDVTPLRRCTEQLLDTSDRMRTTVTRSTLEEIWKATATAERTVTTAPAPKVVERTVPTEKEIREALQDAFFNRLRKGGN